MSDGVQLPVATTAPVHRVRGWRLLAVRLAGLVLRVLNATLRFEVDGGEREQLLRTDVPMIMVLWHNRIVVACGMARRFRFKRGIHAMVSASRDGAYLAAFFESVGIHPARGSSSKRGIAATRELLAVLKRGDDIAITPDGPRGPVYSFQEGASMLALVSGAPLVLMVPNFSHAWRVNAWDGLYVPRPFSRVRMRGRYVAPGELPRDRAQCSAWIRNALMELTVDLPPPPRAVRSAAKAAELEAGSDVGV